MCSNNISICYMRSLKAATTNRSDNSSSYRQLADDTTITSYYILFFISLIAGHILYNHNSIRLYNAGATIAKCVMHRVRLTFIISFYVSELHLFSKTAFLTLTRFWLLQLAPASSSSRSTLHVVTN